MIGLFYSLWSYWIKQSQSDKTVFALGRSPPIRHVLQGEEIISSLTLLDPMHYILHIHPVVPTELIPSQNPPINRIHCEIDRSSLELFWAHVDMKTRLSEEGGIRGVSIPLFTQYESRSEIAKRLKIRIRIWNHQKNRQPDSGSGGSRAGITTPLGQINVCKQKWYTRARL